MMKVVLLLLALATLHVGSATQVRKDRTITQVVKLLQGMLDKSVTEGDEERVIYAKFKCYCDTSDAEKSQSIKELTESISLLQSEIEETQGATGELSSECAQLKSDIADNVAAQKEATTIRKKENKDFIAEKQDLTDAIGQMKSAIDTLAAVGADQTKSTGADNKQFMAGMDLVQVQAVQSALRAVSGSGSLSSEQQDKATAFLQAPFTGTYTSQSAQVMGMIKSMRDTFKKNREDAIKTEGNRLEEYNDFMKVKKEQKRDMDGSYKKKQKELGGNDKDLAANKKALSKAEGQKASDEEFLEKLRPMCEDKAQGFENRKMLRANEETAIAEAISILNSDDAFASFGETDATKSGSTSAGNVKFIQLRSASSNEAETVLSRAAKETKSTRLSKVLAKMHADNPFDEVLDEITNMIEVIDNEGKADKEKYDWCRKERKTNKRNLRTKKGEIVSLNTLIDKLDKRINAKKTGLKAQIAQTEDTLEQNDQSQKTETADRLEENVAYQKDIKNLVTAQGILKKALKVLEAYYDDLEKKLAAGEALLQEDPKAPEAWKGDGDFKGQSSKGGDVVDMLTYILKETVGEEMEAHKDEEKAQADYEDSMTNLKKLQAKNEKSLAGLQDTLAKKEKDLLDAQEDLKDTTEDKEGIEAVLLRIKPGCDFIDKNFNLRNKNRGIEKSALNKATRLIKATPAYKTAVSEATVESYGDCKKPCVKNKSDVKCKACMSDVTIPAYCAGHKGTKGC